MSKINATHFQDLPPFPRGRKKSERRVHAIVQTPKHSRYKYALNVDDGIIAYRDVLPGGLQWPYDYGFVPGTLADDGIEVRVIGVVRETKDGVENDRLIAVPLPSSGVQQRTDAYADIADLPQAELTALTDFLRTYSERQGHAIVVKAHAGADEAIALVAKAKKAFKKAHSDD